MNTKQLRLTQLSARTRIPRVPYFKGMVPLDWLGRASRLPGRTLHAAIALWHLSTLRKSPTVKMQAKMLETFGISREVYARALIRMETEGLIVVERRDGQTPLVTIVDPPGVRCRR